MATLLARRINVVNEYRNTVERSKTILIIDDEKPIRYLLERQLCRQGFRVLTAPDGPSGLQIALAERPDLIILDVMMPAMNGFEVCQRIRNHPELTTTPVIFLTASLTRENKMRAFAVGADDYVVKPFQVDELLAHITAVLRRTQKHQASNGRVVALFGPISGVGTTTLAIQLSEAMALHQDRDVVLVDLDLPYGSIAPMLKLYNRPHIVELLQEPVGAWTADTVRQMLQRHRSNLLVAPAPGGYGPADPQPDPERVRPFLDALVSAGYHVIVDVGSHVNELALAALRRADLAYIITSGEPQANQMHDSFMDTAVDLGLERNRLLSVINDLHGISEQTAQLAQKPLARIARASSYGHSHLWLKDQGLQKLVAALL